MTPLVYCVLRTGGDYTPAHVYRLQRQLIGCDLECLTDANPGALLGVGCTGMRRPAPPGWWSKLELCNPTIPGDVFSLDLDVSILGGASVASFATIGRTTLLRDWYRPGNLNSSMMYLTAADRARIWAAWCGREEEVIARFRERRMGENGDQDFIREVLGDAPERWQDVFPGWFCSYKQTMRNPGYVPGTTRILFFHGKPRPWQVGH